MRNCSYLFFAMTFAAAGFAQQKPASAPPATSTAQPAAAVMPAGDTALKPRGPEAVADKDPNRVVATIDGKQLTAKQALDLLKPFPPDQRKQYESNLSNLIQQVYMREQLADLAAKMNLDQQSPWKDQINLAREGVLAQAYMQHLEETNAGKAPLDTKKYYDEHPDEFDEAKVSGIFINFTPPGTPANASGPNAKTEQQAQDKANDLEKQLRAGGDFAALARTNSDNTQTAEKGGDLGTVELGDPKLPPSIHEALNKLQPGQVSEPVRIQTSYLILKLNSRRKVPYTEVEKSLEQRLKNEQNQNVVKQEVDKYKIKVEDPDFFAAANSRAIPTLSRSVSAPPQPAPEK